jgi:hypothetical protein
MSDALKRTGTWSNPDDSRGQILGRDWEKSLESFSPCYSQLPLLTDFRCNVSPSPTENSWMLHPLDKVSLGHCAPDQTIPALNSFLSIILGGLYGCD